MSNEVIRHLLSLALGAKETHSLRLASNQWVFYPRVLEVGKKQTLLRGEEAFIKKSAMYTYILNTSSVPQ